MRLFFIFPIIILLASTYAGYVYAVGGGGGNGGSGGSSGGSSGGDAGGSSGGGGGGGSEPGISQISCIDTGGVALTLIPRHEFNFTRLKDGLRFGVSGSWDGDDFQSEDAVFTEPGLYEFSSALGLKQNFTCPGFRFSCRIVELNALSCRKNESGIFARFRMVNDDVTDNLKVSFRLSGRKVVSRSAKSYSLEMKGMVISREGPAVYTVFVPAGISPLEFEVLHELCIGKNYVYSKVVCTEGERAEEVKAESGKELKCGGYMSLRDRIACRLGLRDEQRNEYENFYPEECKSGAVNSTECLETYQSVQKCWSFPNGESRINCVKREIKLGDLSAGREACLGLQGTERASCFKGFNKKIYSLVKFRLYNLEEEAERLAERGLIDKNALTDFVVNMELKKQAFNNAKSKEERKMAILEARGEWKSLADKIKKGAE